MSKSILPISVLIPTMNRPNALRRTIDGYINAECIPSQIVVVDQSEKQSDSEAIRNYLSGVKQIHTDYYYQKVASLTAARNNAFRLAREEIIVCSDDDVDVYSDTVKNVFQIMCNPKIAMIAGLNDNMQLGKSKIGYVLGTKSFVNRKIGHVTASMMGRFPEVMRNETDTMWAMGFFFVIRKSLVKRWGICWDEKLVGYAYAEDLDFSFSYFKKAKEEKMECIMTKEVHVKHLTSQEYRTPSRKSTFMYVLNRAYLSKKHNMGVKSVIAMEWCNFWIYLSRLIKNDAANDMKDAMLYCMKNRKAIENGEFDFR